MRKDGTRVYGTVRNIYAEKKMISMKPDQPITVGGNTYPQTFRFRRLAVGEAADIFGLQVAPLVLLAEHNDVGSEARNVFGCKDGLMAADGQRIFVEKMPNLNEGIFKPKLENVTLMEASAESIRGLVFSASDVQKKNGVQTIEDYNAWDFGEPVMTLKVNGKEFNRWIKKLPYTSGYYTKWTDLAMLIIDGSTLQLEVFDGRQQGVNVAASKHDLKVSKKVLLGIKVHGLVRYANFAVGLFYLKEFTRGIRTKAYSINIYPGNVMEIDTVEQRRIQFPRRKVVASNENGSADVRRTS